MIIDFVARGGELDEDYLPDAPVEAWRSERAEEDARRQELHRGGQPAGLVPASHPVAGEELAPARPGQREDVLDVRDRGAHRADDGRVERPARHGQQGEAREPAERLEAPRRDVLVRHRVPDRVSNKPEGERATP